MTSLPRRTHRNIWNGEFCAGEDVTSRRKGENASTQGLSVEYHVDIGSAIMVEERAPEAQPRRCYGLAHWQYLVAR